METSSPPTVVSTKKHKERKEDNNNNNNSINNSPNGSPNSSSPSSPSLSSKSRHHRKNRLQSATMKKDSHSMNDFNDINQFVRSSPFLTDVDSHEQLGLVSRERSGTDVQGRATYDPTNSRERKHKSSRSGSVEDNMDSSQRKELQMEIERANKRLALDLQNPLSLSDNVEERLLRISIGAPSSSTIDLSVSPSDVRTCLKDEQFGFVFWLFLREQYVHDQFSFCLAVEEFKLDESPSQEKANAIIKKYFKAGSEYELNLGEETKLKIAAEVQSNLTRDMFDKIEVSTWRTVEEYYPKFLKSEILRNLQAGKKTRFVIKRRELRRTETYRVLRIFQKDVPTAFDFKINAEEDFESNARSAFGIKRGRCDTCTCRRYEPMEENGICECEHWPANHKELGKLPIKISSIIEDKEKLVQKLIEPGLKLVSVLCDWTDIERKEIVAASIVLIFEYYGRSLNLLKFALDKEIRTAELTTLFREDRMSFRIASHYMRLVSIDWLKKVLGPLVISLKGSTSYEINPHKLVNPVKEKPKNVKNLSKLSQNIFELIIKNASSIPPKLKLFCGLVFKKVKKTFPNHEVNALGVMLFLRFICPALCLPKESGIVDVQLNPNVQRGLILAAKLLQNLSLNIRFNKETWMYELDDFIASNYSQMEKFLTSMVSTEKTSTNAQNVSSDVVSKIDKDNAKNTIYSEIKNTPNILDLAL